MSIPADMDILEAMDKVINALNAMRHNALRNYIVPGLTSELIGGPEHGKVRLFTATRQTHEFITPHSHRFDFCGLVLSGQVSNTLFECPGIPGTDEMWCESTINRVCGPDGIEKYTHSRSDNGKFYSEHTTVYEAGDSYFMAASDIHSVKFSQGAQVLVFEGPPLGEFSMMLEPWVDGKVVPTFRTESWMFEKDMP